MREYKQLTEEDRIEIYAMKQAGKEQNKIAVKLGVHPAPSAGNFSVIQACAAIALSKLSKRLYIEGVLPVRRLR